MVSDGTTVTVYDARSKQAYQEATDASPYAAVISFVAANLTFTFQLVTGLPMRCPDCFVLVGTPIQAGSAYSRVVFFVDAATSHVIAAMTIANNGDRMRFDFDQVELDLPVSPETFRFVLPLGTPIRHV